MRRPVNYTHRKRSATKGAELRGIEVWIRRYRRGWRILSRAWWRDTGETVTVSELDHNSAWWLAFSALQLELEALCVKRADYHMGNIGSGNVIAFPVLTGQLFPKE